MSKSLLTMTIKGKLMDTLFEYHMKLLSIMSTFIIAIQVLAWLALVIFGSILQVDENAHKLISAIILIINVFCNIGMIVVTILRDKAYNKARAKTKEAFNFLDDLLEAAEINNYDLMLSKIIEEGRYKSNESIKTKENE